MTHWAGLELRGPAAALHSTPGIFAGTHSCGGSSGGAAAAGTGVAVQQLGFLFRFHERQSQRDQQQEPRQEKLLLRPAPAGAGRPVWLWRLINQVAVVKCKPGNVTAVLSTEGKERRGQLLERAALI